MNTKLPLYQISSVVMLLEMATITWIPILTWLFFSTNTTLLLLDATHAQRALWYGYCLAAMKCGHILANLFMGVIADWYGRRFALLLALAGLLLLVGSAFFALEWQMPLFLLIGLFIGNIFNAVKPVGLTYVADISNESERLHSIACLQAFLAFGACVGPLLFGVIAEYSGSAWSIVVFLVVILSMAAFLLVNLPKPSINFQPTALNLRVHLKRFVMDPMFNYGIGVLFLVQLCWAMFFEFSPGLVRYYFDFSAWQIGFYVAFVTLSLLITASVIVPRLRRFYTKLTLAWFALNSILCGVLCAIVACVFDTFTFSVVLFFVGAFLIAAGDVILYILIMDWFTKLTEPTNRGQMIGLLHVGVAFIWMLAALMGGYLMAWLSISVLLFMLVNIAVLMFSFVTKSVYLFGESQS